MKLNEMEAKVLAALANDYGDFGYYGFRGIKERSRGLNIKQIRRACRSLKKKGLAEFSRGLFTEDGEMAGSGYGATKAGAELFKNGAVIKPMTPISRASSRTTGK